MEVTFSVNPLDNKEVRFTYLDRMVHDAVYTIYHNHLEKNHGINPKFEINYQMIMSVMSGKPQQTNLKFNNARRVVLRDSLLKLASIDIFIDASSLYPDEPQNNYIFYGKLIQLKEMATALVLSMPAAIMRVAVRIIMMEKMAKKAKRVESCWGDTGIPLIFTGNTALG